MILLIIVNCKTVIMFVSFVIPAEPVPACPVPYGSGLVRDRGNRKVCHSGLSGIGFNHIIIRWTKLYSVYYG